MFSHYIWNYLYRLLLLDSAEKQSPLCRRSNASWLPCLFWGSYSFYNWKISLWQLFELLEADSMTPNLMIAVFVWIKKWCHCYAMWTYNTSELPEWNEGAFPVSITKFLFSLFSLFIWKAILLLKFDSIYQVCLPSLLEVSLWYVKGLGEIWPRDCCYTNAWTISK